uniref:Scavenger receptor class B member 1 n=1 Tax=Cacopsylla melanoneura TaxID=428564 RepID=A0A8D9F287_9HEMI
MFQTTGIPLDVGARFQINLLLQPIKNVVMYRHVPRVFFPMIWFSNRATMPRHMAEELQLLLNVPCISLIFSGAVLLLGVALIAYRILGGAPTDSHQTQKLNDKQCLQLQ